MLKIKKTVAQIILSVQQVKMELTFVALLAWISGKAFKTTADGVVTNGLARGKTSADSSLTYWNTLGGRAVTITIVRAIVIGLTFSDNHY